MIEADYVLKLKGGDVPLSFRYKTFVDYSQLKGMDYEDVGRLIAQGAGFKGNDIPVLLLTAHKVWCIFNGKECTKTELDSMLWMDELNKTPDVAVDILYVYVAGYTGKSVEEVRKTAVDVEGVGTTPKKKAAKKKA